MKLQNEKLMKKYEVVDNKSVEYTTKKNNFRWINDEVDIVDTIIKYFIKLFSYFFLKL